MSSQVRKVEVIEYKDIPKPCILLILDYFHWGNYFGFTDSNHEYNISGEMQIQEFYSINDHNEYFPSELKKVLHGKFKNDSTIFLMVRYGLHFIIESESDVSIGEIIPSQAKGVVIVVEGEGEKKDCESIDLDGFPRRLDTLMCSGLSKEQIVKLLKHNPNLRRLTVERISGKDNDFKITNRDYKLLARLTSLRLHCDVEFENDSVKNKFLKESRLQVMNIMSCPSIKGRYNNPHLKSLVLHQRMKMAMNPSAILISLMMMRLQGGGGESNPLVESRLKELRDSVIVREELDTNFYRKSFPNLRKVVFDNVEMKLIAKFLDRNSICEDVFIGIPRGFSEIVRFKNNKVTCFATRLSEGKANFFHVIGCFSNLKKLSIISRTSQKQGEGMNVMLMMMIGKTNFDLSGFVDVDLSTTPMRRIFTKGFCERIEDLELMIPKNEIPLDIAKRFKNLRKLCLSCKNFSEVLEQMLQKNESLEDLTIVNILKTKDAAQIAKNGKKVKNFRFFESFRQSVEVLKYNTNIQSFRQCSRKNFYKKTWRREDHESSQFGGKNKNVKFPSFEEEGDVVVPSQLPANFSTKYYFVPPFQVSRIGTEYTKERMKYFGQKFEYTDSGEDDWDREGEKGNVDVSLGESKINTGKKEEMLKLMNTKFSKVPNNPTEEEKKVFQAILDSCAQTKYDNDYDRTDTNHARIYSIVGKGEYFDTVYIDHHRGRSTYHEAFSYLTMKYSRDGKERRLYSTDYDMSNFEEHVFFGRKLVQEIKLRLFGPSLFGDVDDMDVLELFVIVAGGSRYCMKWIREMDNKTFRVDEDARENEDGSEGWDDYGEEQSEVELMFGKGDGILNAKEYVSEIFDLSFN